MSSRSRWVRRVMRKFGYHHRDSIISGQIKWKLNEQPFVNLTIPGGQRVYGWVDSRLPPMLYGDNPSIPTPTAEDDEHTHRLRGITC